MLYLPEHKTDLKQEKDGVIALTKAIINQARRDLIKAYYKDKTRPHSYRTESMIADCEKFFRSEWGQMLTLHHGESIIEQCKSKADKIEQNNISSAFDNTKEW